MTQRIPPHGIEATGYVGDGAQFLADDGTWKAGAGGVSSVVAGTGIAVDSTDPANPIVSATGGGGGGGGDTAWHLVGATGEPAFENSFANYGAGYSSCGFRKLSSGLVVVKGLVKRVGSTGSISNLSVFTLPTGYRPAENLLLPTYCEPSPVVVPRLDVFTTGVVRISVGTSGWTSLDTIRFYAG